MKSKQRILAIVLLCSALVVMGVIQCFADTNNIMTQTPSDIGELVLDSEDMPLDNKLHKYYIKMTLTISGTSTNKQIISYYLDDNNNRTYGGLTIAIFENNTNYTYIQTYLHTSKNSFYAIALFREKIEQTITYYVPLYCYNYQISTNVYPVYYSITQDEEQLKQEYYALGYTNGYQEGYNTGYDNGYPEGFNDAQNIKQDLNIVEHIEQLIAQFTGNEYAKYITPIALVLTILLIYFLFIRFLLSLIKAKGVIKTCDIIMIVGCIIVLVIMYAPLLDLTIKNETIQTETTTEIVEQVNRTKIVIEHTETGDIYYGPVGTAIIPIYEIAEDTVTKAVTP